MLQHSTVDQPEVLQHSPYHRYLFDGAPALVGKVLQHSTHLVHRCSSTRRKVLQHSTSFLQEGAPALDLIFFTGACVLCQGLAQSSELDSSDESTLASDSREIAAGAMEPG